MRIIATDGPSRYLLVEDGVHEVASTTEARILDTDQGRLYPWKRAHEILRFGQWTEYDGAQAVLDQLLDGVEEVEFDRDAE